MRIATFNLESLDMPVAPRKALLVPALERLDADIVCLQEVNAQRVAGSKVRAFTALDDLVAGTRYEKFHRSATHAGAPEKGPADVHNLVTLSRYPIAGEGQVLHELLPALETRLITAEPVAATAAPVRFDRPVLVTGIETPSGVVTVVNVHLRAPIASAVPGGKLGPYKWKSVAGWAEGYYLSGLKRVGQAFELRLLVDGIFDSDAGARVLVAGDFNAEANETPVRLLAGEAEDTGNADLAHRSLVILDRAVEVSRRFSVVHHGRPQMLDHMLASHALYGRFQRIEVHNEALGDEAVGWAKAIGTGGSYHAAVVAEFAD